MIVYDEMEFENNDHVHFKIQLPGELCMIGGDSSTGKSLFVNSLRKIVQLQKSIPISKSKYPQIGNNIAIFNYELSDLTPIYSLENNLIIIDNASLFFSLSDNVDLAQHINTDRRNQYMIFTRSQSKLRTPLQFDGYFLNNGNLIYTEYYKEFGKWW